MRLPETRQRVWAVVAEEYDAAEEAVRTLVLLTNVPLQTLARMQRMFVLVLVSAQFVFHLMEGWPAAAVQWLRKLGGKLEVGMDRDGPYLVLRGLVALWQTVATLTFLVIEPFPRQLFAPPNRCG